MNLIPLAAIVVADDTAQQPSNITSFGVAGVVIGALWGGFWWMTKRRDADRAAERRQLIEQLKRSNRRTDQLTKDLIKLVEGFQRDLDTRRREGER